MWTVEALTPKLLLENLFMKYCDNGNVWLSTELFGDLERS